MNHSILNNRLHHLTVGRGTHEPLNVALDTHCSLPWITQPDGEPVLDALRDSLVRLWHGLAEDPPPPPNPGLLDSNGPRGTPEIEIDPTPYLQTHQSTEQDLNPAINLGANK